MQRATPYAVGSRLLIGGKHKATVRYSGAIEGQEGDWVGVEWDDADRGKHSGAHEGRHYFDCAPGCGSFVRQPKLLAIADAGRSLADAVAERYTPAAATGGTADQGEMYVPTASQRKVHIELVGAERAAAALAVSGGLTQASLIGMRVSSSGLTEAACRFLCRVSSMDLSDNLISDWQLVCDLSAALPALHTLNLSGNRLHLPLAPAPGAPSRQLTNLRSLVLNRCGVTWRQAAGLCRSLPALAELRLCGNRLGDLRLDGELAADLPAVLAPLRTLDLEDNLLEEWEDVASLRHLPSLRALLLSHNRLREVAYPGGFATLSCLLLGSNRLSSWRAVDALNQFPSLAEARLSDNPLAAADPGAARYEAIARVAGLAVLNGSQVGAAERWDAELNYLRHATNELAACRGSGGEAGQVGLDAGAGGDEAGTGRSRDAVLRAHPRFATLHAKYGDLAPAAPASGTGGSALAGSMLEVALVFRDREVRKKVPATLTVGRLKLLAEKLLRVKAARQALVLTPLAGPAGGGAGVEPEDITTDDSRELRYYGVGGGCRVEVVEDDPAERAAAAARARAAAAALQELRMERHEQGLLHLRAEEERRMA